MPFFWPLLHARCKEACFLSRRREYPAGGRVRLVGSYLHNSQPEFVMMSSCREFRYTLVTTPDPTPKTETSKATKNNILAGATIALGGVWSVRGGGGRLRAGREKRERRRGRGPSPIFLEQKIKKHNASAHTQAPSRCLRYAALPT